MKTFPKNFWWGAATSGPQSEGRFNKKHANVFDYHFEIEPEKFHNHVGPDVASNFYNSYQEDIQMMRSIGMNSLRTSIQWSRLIDDLETNTVNQDAVDFYNNVIDAMIAEGMTPTMNLHHFDLPVELFDKYGGWESKKVVELYVGFAEKCFELFGDRVKFWTTHNEPMVVVEGEYLFQFHYPNIVDGKKAVQVAYNLNLASAKAIQAFRKMNIEDAQIGTILNLTPTYAASDAPEDQEAARIAELWNNKMFLEPAIYGHFPTELEELLTKDKVLWETTDEEKEILKNNTVDFLGVNYYQPRRVKAREEEYGGETWAPEKYFDNYDMPGKRMNPHRGWEIYPKAIYDIAKNVQDNYGNIKWFISENGMGVEGEEKFKNAEGIIEDDYRIEFIQEHLYYLSKGIEEGSNCFGYHLWTPIDCWSWCNAYRNRYGYISLDLNTGKKTIKKSGLWIKEVSKENSFDLTVKIK